MSGRRYDDDGGQSEKGSVRRAREAMQPTNGYGSDGMSRINQLPSRLPVRKPPPVPAAFPSAEYGPRTPHMAPSPWPLSDSNGRPLVRHPENAPHSSRPAQKPQRPPRPGPRNPPPPLPLDSRALGQDSKPSYRQPPRATEYRFEEPPQPFAPHPDFLDSPDSFSDPFSSPEISPQLLRNQFLGPPPSRRGNSFFPAGVSVSPIQEESSENSPRGPVSYASSRAIPSSWGTAPLEGDFVHPPRESFDTSDADGDGLLRQASVGKRAKPSLRTISKPQTSQTPEIDNQRGLTQNPEIAKITSGLHIKSDTQETIPTTAATLAADRSKVFSPTRLSSDSSTTDGSLDDLDLEKPPVIGTRYPISTSSDDIRELELEDASRDGSTLSLHRLDLKRPPPINIDAVREAEARGSLTSLPDLIRRATRLASNLDRGKTASKLGMLDMLNASGGVANGRGRQSGSISDILASFPPPGPIGTSIEGSRRSVAFDNRGNPNAPGARNGDGPAKPQRCCGMSRCAFVMIIVVVFLLISSAVVIPVVLIALPRQNDNNNQNEPVTTPSICQTTHPCLNGGVSVGREGACGCVCVNGFRGPRCAVPGDSSCSTININQQYQNATLGNALPRLFQQCQTNFSIPLNASKILGLFNQEDLSCTSENALVTFNGANQRRNTIFSGLDAASHHSLSRRSRRLVTRITKPLSLPANVIDFARVAVLFVFELSEEIRSASGIHDAIQGLLKIASSDFDTATQRPLEWRSANNQFFSLNFRDLTIRLGNGTVVGQKSMKQN